MPLISEVGQLAKSHQSVFDTFKTFHAGAKSIADLNDQQIPAAVRSVKVGDIDGSGTRFDAALGVLRLRFSLDYIQPEDARAARGRVAFHRPNSDPSKPEEFGGERGAFVFRANGATDIPPDAGDDDVPFVNEPWHAFCIVLWCLRKAYALA